MKRRLASMVLGLCIGGISGLVRAQGPQLAESLAAKTPPRDTNAAAGELARVVVPLGLDFTPDDTTADHPSEADVEMLVRAGSLDWLNSQLIVPDDSISSEPETLRGFLESRGATLGRVVAVLEKGLPEWHSSGHGKNGPSPRFLALIRLNRILLSATLIEERSGRVDSARRLLEASWTLYRALSNEPHVISEMLAVSFLSQQVGVLRKVREPPVEWLNRLSGEDPWLATLEAFATDPFMIAEENPAFALDALSNSFPNINARAHRAAANTLRRVAPCDLKNLSDEEIGRPMAEEYRKTYAPGADSDEIAQVLTEIIVPGLRNNLTRAGRLVVDSELSLKILELRLARSNSRDRRWPESLEDEFSRVCPGVTYAYRREGSGMEIEFKGWVPAGESGLKLPLTFSTRADRRPTPPAPSASPTPTSTPAPEPN